MGIAPFQWQAVNQFLGRQAELVRLEAWWNEPAGHGQGMNLYGRRRVGKSWLFRRFAHGKPAIILVAEQTTQTQQMGQLADQLEQILGLRPALRDVGDLFRFLYKVTSGEKVLVVIDEFPYLLGSTRSEISGAQSSIQAAIEQHRDRSEAKFLICGSTITQMEDIQAEKNPLHGRFDKLVLNPLPFGETRGFMPTLDVTEQFERFAVAGGMPRYLHALSGGNWDTTLATKIIDSNAPLFNEPVSLLQSELRETATYLAILNALSVKPAHVGSISQEVGLDSKTLSPYLDNLRAMRLAAKRMPVGADPTSRSGQWECLDHFVRFWFRFVKPFQTDLEAGGDPAAHVKNFVRTHLPEHVAVVFEDAARRWTRQQYGAAQTVGPWWGNALNAERRAKRRETEEIDIVGLAGKRVVVAGEVKWTGKQLPLSVLTDLRTYKLPAMQQAGFTVTPDVKVVLASKSGFTTAVASVAKQDPHIHLVHAKDLLVQLP